MCTEESGNVILIETVKLYKYKQQRCVLDLAKTKEKLVFFRTRQTLNVYEDLIQGFSKETFFKVVHS